MTSKSKKYCSVPQCKNYISENVSMHYFPHEKKLAKEWKVKLKIAKPLSKYMSVCSEHFKEIDFTTNTRYKKLKKNVIPSEKLPKINLYQKKLKSRSNRALLRESVKPGSSDIEEDLVALQKLDIMKHAQDKNIANVKTQSSYGNYTKPVLSSDVFETEFANKEVQTNFPFYNLGNQLNSDYKLRCFTEFIQNDNEMCRKCTSL